MKPPSSPTTSTSDDPEAHLLDRFLAVHPAGEAAQLEAWLELQPETASDEELRNRLRRALEDWRRAGSLFARAMPGPTSESGGDLLAGQIVGDFRLVRFVARGGMGQVWEAAQISLGERRVALKLILPEKLDERSRTLFEREARAGGRLQHAGVVTVYGHGISAGLSWIAMEFVEGGRTLRDHIAELSKLGTLPKDHDRWVAQLVAQIAEAMQVAHDAGVVHRDLKPQNVLLTRAGTPKVSDFGLARILDEPSQSVSGQQVGTFLYMSPEQVAAHAQTIDHRADVFSLGVVLYELLTLQRPFHGDTTHQVAAQILTKDPPDPRTLRSTLARDMAVIVGKALEKERERRFQSMGELAADLRRFLAHEAIHAMPPALPARIVKWARRNRVAALSFLLAAMMAMGSASLLWLQQQRRITNMLADAQSAARRGDAKACMGFLDQARELKARIPEDLRIYEVDALIASQQNDLARTKVMEWVAEERGSSDGRAQLRSGLLTLAEHARRGEELLKGALEAELGEADRLLAQAMLAATVPDCLQLLRQAVETEPGSYLYRMVLSMALLVSGRLEEAESRARSMQEMFPKDPRGTLVLRLIALLAVQPEEKGEILAWARTISPEAESLFASARLAGKLLSLEALSGKPIDEARNELDLIRLFQEGHAERALLAFMPRIPSLFRSLSSILEGFHAYAGGNPAEGERLFELALECDPENSLAAYLLAAARMDRDAPDEEAHAAKLRAAVDAFREASLHVSLFPDVPAAAALRFWDGLVLLGTATKVAPDEASIMEARKLTRTITLGKRRAPWVYEDMMDRALASNDPDIAEMSAVAFRRDHPDRALGLRDAKIAVLTQDWAEAIRICDDLLVRSSAEEEVLAIERVREDAVKGARTWFKSVLGQESKER